MILPTYHFYTVIFREKVSRIKQKEKGTWDKQVIIRQSLVQWAYYERQNKWAIPK